MGLLDRFDELEGRTSANAEPAADAPPPPAEAEAEVEPAVERRRAPEPPEDGAVWEFESLGSEPVDPDFGAPVEPPAPQLPAWVPRSQRQEEPIAPVERRGDRNRPADDDWDRLKEQVRNMVREDLAPILGSLSSNELETEVRNTLSLIIEREEIRITPVQ